MCKRRILKPAEFDIRIIQAVRAIRELRRIKQIAVALDLGMSECNYSKIENGYKAISISQLKRIAASLNVSVFLLLALAESENLVNQKMVPVSEIILDFIQSARTETHLLSHDEVDFIRKTIREAHASSLV